MGDSSRDGSKESAQAGAATGMEEQVNDLLSHLPRTAIRAAIDEIDRSGGSRSEKGSRLKGALVHHFNHLRPHKARRLFTSLFEPLLTDDLVLFRAVDWVPGLVQRADIGGLWHAMAQMGFPELALAVQREVDRLSGDRILDEVLADAEALALRERMRTEAAGYLTGLPFRRRVLDSFLQMANRAGLKEARSKLPELERKAAIDPALVEFIAQVLAHDARLLPVIETFKKSIGGDPATDPEQTRQARVAHATCQHLKAEFGNLPADSPVIWLPVLLLLNNLRRFGVVAKYLSQFASLDGPDQVVLGRALTSHLVAACRTMADELKQLIPPPDADADGTPPLVVSTPMRARLEESLLRFDRAIHLLHLGDGSAERRSAMQLKEHLGDIAALLTGPVLDLVERQAIVASGMRIGMPQVNENLLWLLNFLWRWGKVLVSVGYSNQEIENLKSRIGEDIERAFRAALRFNDSDNLENRMAHLVRLNQIMRSFDADIGPWISAVSVNVQKIVRHYLGRRQHPSFDERFVIETCIRAIREELDRNRYWQLPELVELVRLYDQRTGGGPNGVPLT
ncbi:MAG TPA: hypothetical protein VEB64_01570 [Azospirillaceae bacterium]|nr:hypothetical protein [Azospirillaceae bacterium]